jgi:hypothetical protein
VMPGTVRFARPGRVCRTSTLPRKRTCLVLISAEPNCGASRPAKLVPAKAAERRFNDWNRCSSRIHAGSLNGLRRAP